MDIKYGILINPFDKLHNEQCYNVRKSDVSFGFGVVDSELNDYISMLSSINGEILTETIDKIKRIMSNKNDNQIEIFQKDYTLVCNRNLCQFLWDEDSAITLNEEKKISTELVLSLLEKWIFFLNYYYNLHTIDSRKDISEAFNYIKKNKQILKIWDNTYDLNKKIKGFDITFRFVIKDEDFNKKLCWII